MLLLWLACKPPLPSDPPTPEPPWMAPDDAGPYPVGVRTTAIEAARGALTVELWYPAQADASGPARYDLPYTVPSFAVRDAMPADRPFPVVAFSHGHGGTRHQSVFLMERLASHGMIVASADHPLDTAFDLDADRVDVVASRRPGDVSQVLDWVLSPGSPVHADPDAIAVAGHSFGAWTALVLAGGGLDLEAGTVACAAPQRPPGCDIVGSVAEPLPVADARIRATVLLAPGGAYSFSTLGAITDVLVVSGSADGDLPFVEEQAPVYDGLGIPRNRLILVDGGHFGFTDACALLPIADCAGPDAGFMDPLRMQHLSATAATAFLGFTLAEEPRYGAWLTPEAWTDDTHWE